MYKVKWDCENNGVILDANISNDESISPPRPVFLQELELLEINKKIKLPITDLPICWCVDYRYYYKGKLFFERRGARIYSRPEIIFNEEFPFRILEPININKVVELNREAITTIENEAMDFIQDCYDKFKGKVDDFVVAFSGGKDSQVILDLVSRVLPPENYKAIFQDTDMELPCTYDIVEHTEEDYKYKFPNFKMYHAKSDKRAIDLWKQFGPPSRINRWCCSVLKTALFRRTMKEIHNTNKQPRVVVYEGVRSDESPRRETYDRIGDSVKHPNLINCRAIFKWNNSEIFLYLFSREVVLNPAYRLGLTRVGCGVCPFASDWSEYVIRRIYPDISKQYVEVIEQMGKNLGIKDRSKLNEYINSGNWQKNAGGRGIKTDGSRIDVVSKSPNFECIITKPKVDWKIWLNALATYIIKENNGTYVGEFKYKDEIVKFIAKEENENVTFKIDGTTNKLALTGLLIRVLNKSAACELCGVCEAECPTGALKVRDKVELDKNMCIHCKKCLEVSSRGCIIAHRKQVYEGISAGVSSNVRTSGIDKYSTFGLRDEWVSNYFAEGNDWFGKYPGLGSKMIPAAINWLREAELINSKEKKTSEKFEWIKKVYYNNPLIAWQIIWVGLSFNSAIVSTYVRDIKFGIMYSQDDLVEIVKDNFPNLNETTIRNPINALINMFKNSPLGMSRKDFRENSNIYVGEMKIVGRNVKGVKKIVPEYVSLLALAYLMYKNAHKLRQYDTTVTDLLSENGINPFTVFGMTPEKLIKSLNSLVQMNILSADLLGGLENVHFDKDMLADDVLITMIKRL